MSVMESGFIPYNEPPVFGRSMGVGSLIAPPGVPTSNGDTTDVYGDLTRLLGLANLGTYTPWAERTGSMNWEQVNMPPETNIAVAGLNDALLAQSTQLMFGQKLGWIAVLSDQLPAIDAPGRAFQGTAYEFFQTLGVYNQDDPSTPPRIRFLHWARLREQTDKTSGGGSIEAAAAALGGRPVFAVQVDYTTTAKVPLPAQSFEEVIRLQLSAGTPAPVGPTPTPAPAPAKASSVNKAWPMVVGAGLLMVVGGFVITRAVQQKKGR
jgi:hypothetical protein